MDHSLAIRSEITNEVLSQIGSHASKPVGVKVGYIRNSHRGYPVYTAADTIYHLPVTIDYDKVHSVTVMFEPLKLA